jgi:hypothetical protein
LLDQPHRIRRLVEVHRPIGPGLAPLDHIHAPFTAGNPAPKPEPNLGKFGVSVLDAKIRSVAKTRPALSRAPGTGGNPLGSG